MNTIQEQIAAIEEANKSDRYNEAEQQCRELLSLALIPEQKVIVLLQLSLSLKERGMTQEAFSYVHNALAIAEEIDNKELQGKAYENLGQLHRNLSQYYESLSCYQKALEIFEKLGTDVLIAQTCSNIGIVFDYLSDFTRALEYQKRAYELYIVVEKKPSIAVVLSNIGIIYRQLLDYDNALEYYHQSLAIFEELDIKSGIAINLGNIGNIYVSISDYVSALEYYHQALALNEELGRKNNIANNYCNIGSLYRKMEDYPLALEYLNKSMGLCEEVGNKSVLAICYSNIGAIYASTEFQAFNPATAEKYLRKGILLNEELGTKQQLYESYKFLSDFYKQQEQWREYAEFLQQYYETEKLVQSEDAKKKADQINYERKEAEREKQRAVRIAQAETMEKLLYKTFPSPLVPRLTRGEELVVERYTSISVLFADLAGFTKLSLSINPETMIEMLNYIFTNFDTIIKEAGGHRLRTIGDGYFAICGAPDMVENHQYKLAKAALAMQKDIILPEHIQQELPKDTVLDIRIGLHCGEAVCGMVGGLEKWQYDAYGDTINTASRMESHGEAGKIHISEDFKNALLRTHRDASMHPFEFIPREPMFIKGKGMMNTFFLS